MQSYNNESVYKALKELKVITPEKLDKAYSESNQKQLPLDEILLENELIDDADLGRVIAESMKTPFVELSKLSIPQDLLVILPEVMARNKKAITFARDAQGLKIAMNNPGDANLISSVAKKTGDKVIPYYATERDIDNTLRLYQKEMQKTFDELLKYQVDAAGKTNEKEIPIAKIVDLLIEYAFENKVSDIHFEPVGGHSLVRFRIDGLLHDVLTLPTELHSQIVTRIKVLSKLRTDEHLSAQDGKLQVEVDNQKLDLRISIVPIVDGEKVVMRLLSSSSRQFSLNNLGMSDTDIKKVHEGFTKPYGMVLSTGPTGSGKTTTIYAIVKIINSREKNIATIEDPVEYDIEGINQIQVNPKTNLTFADGLRSILRQDPDIIFVGEIRDAETAGIAVNSAMTGHLVLSTLHTNDAATALPRLIDMNIEPFLIASTVNVIVGQRLVRKICEKCIYSENISFQDLEKLLPKEVISREFKKNKPARIYKGKGCPVCHSTGYTGRVGIFEVLVVTDAIRKLITQKASAEEISKKAQEEGMVTMMLNGLAKVKEGITTIDEVLRATKI